jgi:hypothetical protein
VCGCGGAADGLSDYEPGQRSDGASEDLDYNDEDEDDEDFLDDYLAEKGS